ncbi:MAG: NAD(P)-dependent oxidoreductase [Caldilineaceae bacterium]|nr:NAD(P)-dependent oxidoreductase [Caldilineaceae bacterium]
MGNTLSSTSLSPDRPAAIWREPTLPTAIASEDELEELLTEPTAHALSALQTLDSDLLILGVGGKMGPTLARMAAKALTQLGSPYQVIAVARFSQPALRTRLEGWGIQTIACDLLDRDALAALPASRNVIFMAGQKFGTTGAPSLTWAMNTHMPALVAERYQEARIVAFSTGNVYPLTPVVQGGSVESDPPNPVGEYASSCLGRERIFEHFALTRGLRCAIMRLNYAIELRYGVLLDIALKVKQGQPVDLSQGAANVIWQGDANAQALALLQHCATPAFVLNVTGPETISVRRVAERFGTLFGVEPHFTGTEATTALLNNAAKAQRLFGYPRVSLHQIVEWTAAWVEQGGIMLNKPTHFEARDGRF